MDVFVHFEAVPEVKDSPEDPLWGLLSCHQVVAFLQVSIRPGTEGEDGGGIE